MSFISLRDLSAPSTASKQVKTDGVPNSNIYSICNNNIEIISGSPGFPMIKFTITQPLLLRFRIRVAFLYV